MKKIILLSVVATFVALASCKQSCQSTEATQADSTITVDTTSPELIEGDSTAVLADTTAAAL
jgi:hypothetical protein